MNTTTRKPLWSHEFDAGTEAQVGYTLGWNLVEYHEDGVARAPAVSLCPDRALIVFAGDDRPRTRHGQLVFPHDSGLAPMATVSASPVERSRAGDAVATVELQAMTVGLARLQLAWLHTRLTKGEALPPETTQLELERINEPDRIDRILRMLRQTNASATVVGTASRGGRRSLPARFDCDGSLLVKWDRALQIEAPLQVRACGYNSVYEFVWPDSTEFVQSVGEIVRRRRRRFRRVRAPQRTSISFTHPLWPQLRIERSVRDVSINGLSFETDAVHDVLYPGLVVDAAVTWKRGTTLRFRAQVRHCTPIGKGRRHVCGLSLQPVDEIGGLTWSLELESLLEPSTHRHPDPRALWQLYEQSGYFRLSDKTPVAFTPLRGSFDAQFTQPERRGGVVTHFGVEAEGRLEAAVGQIEVWTGSWLVFQGARQGAGRPLVAANDEVLRDLYVRAYEHVLHRPDASYLVSYVQDVARFSRMCQLDFGTRLLPAGCASVSPFRAYELEPRRLLASPKNGTQVELARSDERAWIDHVLRTSRSPHYLAATGLDLPHLDLGTIQQRWQRCGLDRDREVLVARDGGVAQGALVVERADDGLHLFGLLDLARWVPLRPGARAYLRDALVAAARWYADAGKRRFVYFEEEQPDAPIEVAEANDLGLAYLIAFPVRFLPEFLEHVYEITAPKNRSA